ncbi:MAG TPA: type II secretion system protein [Sedimentisphaerales bacterium]|nr:type II secretion system protein [Sedimentisphaerales bacterium]
MFNETMENGTLKRVKDRSASGFTVVELLVVTATIAVLVSILMPSLSRARVAAMRLRCAHNLKQIYIATDLYLNANDETYPCAQDPLSSEPFYWLWMGRGWRRFVEPYLGGSIDVNNPSVLFCPQDKSKNYESTSYAYSMSFYHSSEQINAASDKSDTYSKPVPSIPRRRSEVARPSGKILIGEWLSNHQGTEVKDPGWWGWVGSRNFLLADGQVCFLKAREIRAARDGYPDANLTIDGIKGRDLGP